MISKNSRPAAALAVIFEFVLIISAAVKIISKQWNGLLLIFMTGICILLPFVITYIADKKNIILPPGFQIVSLLFILSAEYLGEIEKFYVLFWWWDLLLHAVSGSYAVITALYFMRGIIIKNKKSTIRRYYFTILLLAFSFSVSLGALWEIFEFTGDYILKTSMVKGGLQDTAEDLIIKVLSAFITSILCYFRSLIN